MTILQEILTWTQGLPAWQSDAVSRLLVKQTLTPLDHEDLYALLKLNFGIPDPKNRQAKPLTADKIPVQVKKDTNIKLFAIKNLHNVNAIAENQQLVIGPTGMTIIYGDNGSGKSGYSRVLKQACRARDQSEHVHPNANLPAVKAGNAQASFNIAIDGTDKEVTWHQGKVVDIRAFEAALVVRHEAIKTAIVSHNWTGLDPALDNPANKLKDLAGKLNSEAEALEKASNEEARTALQKQLGELDARFKLSQVKEAVLAAVTKLGHLEKLKNCLSAVRTNAISTKASELAEKVVSKELADALNREFRTLGVGGLSVSLQSRTDRGKALHKLKLHLPQSRAPGEILSEGEQRAIALGSFLAEVGLSGSKGGVVFDDPVSSLDHRRRERVAKRLADEALQRQVIIFTHDIYFLCLLTEEAKQAGATVFTQSLTRRAEGFGIADPELPFEGKNTSKRIGALKAQQQLIAKLYKEGNEQEHQRQTVDAYFRLRMAWERAVEEVLLREVILRFRKGIETQRLIGVIVDDNDYTQVHAGMSKCSNYAHDKAVAGGVAAPDPEELLADIITLENWRSQIHKRSEETAKKRKMGPAVTVV
ncbi:AAA domain-containing protein [Pantoea ananatis]|uniref:AAA family ATPase n=1 Tax=Pantoea ananas TaxID=553 RepID=UPI00099B7554|nr:AAA family ATPase [Pantoea ananatis]SKA63603.1 AAA domain-containing protein [Pantoea ananatis]